MNIFKKCLVFFFVLPVQALGAGLCNEPASPAFDSLAQALGWQPSPTYLCGGYYLPIRLFDFQAAEVPPGTVLATADRYQFTSEGLATLCGQVILQQDGLQIESDTVTLDQPRQTADLKGHIKILQSDTLFTGTQARVDMNKNEIELDNADFLLYSNQTRGHANAIHSYSSGEQIDIKQGLYTRCPPGNSDWSLQGSRFLINRQAGWGRVHHMRLAVKDTPILYIPYFKFPIDDRRHTGFLYPEISSISEPDITLPFYWNIAPNYDLTIAPRKIGGRGVLYENEFRYLFGSFPDSETSGHIRANRLPEDKKFNHEDRESLQWQQVSQWSDHTSLDLDFNYVSDNDYLHDFGTDLSSSSASYLNRVATLSHQQAQGSIQARLQSYQTIDETITAANLPYRRLPEILASYEFAEDTAVWSNTAQYVYFAQPEHPSYPYAHRMHWQSRLEYPQESIQGFFRPALSLHYSEYWLSPVSRAVDDRINRTVPTISFDSGLFFERSLPAAPSWTQTLEPRIFHTYTPFKEQDAIPNFDTSELTFGIDQLFRENRFSGPDRIGDTHQTTFALTSRLLDPVSEEIFSATLGQIYFHKNRRVFLEPGRIEDTHTSPMVLMTQARISSYLSNRSGLTWDVQSGDLNDGFTQLNYQNTASQLWYLAYRYRKETALNTRIDQLDLAFRQRLSNLWHLVGRLNFDLENQKTLEQISGLQYESCCWKASFVYHKRIRVNLDNETDLPENKYAFLVQFELKGIGTAGKKLTRLLTDSIPGYVLDND